MLTTLLGVALLIVLAYIFYSLMARAFRSRRLVTRIFGGLFSGLLGTLFAAVAIVALMGVSRVESPRAGPAPDIKVNATPQMVERGEQLAWLCVDCHSSERQLPLNGGTRNMLPASPPLGSVYAPNLTPGGPVAAWKDGDLVRAIREGLDDRGRALVVQPSRSYRNISDEDAQALVAYLRSQSSLRHDQPTRNISFIGSLLIGAGLAPTAEQPPLTGPVTAPARGISPDYGRYLVSFSGCQDCHGLALDGVSTNTFAPHGPSLRAVPPAYSEAQFIDLFRTGKTPDGRAQSSSMPWQYIGRAMSDDDLRAMHAYLRNLQ